MDEKLKNQHVTAVQKDDSIEEEGIEPVQVKTILVLDSNEKELDQSLQSLRKNEAYKVVGAESIKECLDIMSKDIPDPMNLDIIKNVPDLLIMDSDLKDGVGWNFLNDIRFDSKYWFYRNVNVIILTNQAITLGTSKIPSAESVHDYLLKGKVKGDELLNKIDKYFETRLKIKETSKNIKKISTRMSEEYVRISFAIRVRLKYLSALKKSLVQFKETGADASEGKELEDAIYLQSRDLMKYEKRRREIKKRLKELPETVKEDERGNSDNET